MQRKVMNNYFGKDIANGYDDLLISARSRADSVGYFKLLSCLYHHVVVLPSGALSFRFSIIITIILCEFFAW